MDRSPVPLLGALVVAKRNNADMNMGCALQMRAFTIFDGGLAELNEGLSTGNAENGGDGRAPSSRSIFPTKRTIYVGP